ncbi:phytanoyl-CoA dioxygenase family protein [Acuticoccus sp. I52.16.1]|uniref:phytanoyl-CoA dioxygenase family protein n=1 Tax=Acuticoccus sp. I52.16.1 TaxID=2928472 RepID=UPI001FD52135|nr:phytanoyl-CoA dioxygenase family protein [Acuticoccus sp. I52.16.1]UOM35614.1 phytanoyl-CoA dioxygenase family protein [Acuticoccus sp. I52.16.1]
MSRSNIAQLILAAPAVLTAEKSFRRNPVIGSERLNQRGLHRRRVALAARMAERRRAALAPRLDPDERARFDRDGFVIRENALPPELLARVREELATRPLPAWEMRQGQTINRVLPLPRDRSALGELARFVHRPDVHTLIGYAAGRTGNVVTMLQTIAVDPASGESDPQAHLHADTFHPTAKFWLFLHDVGDDDGPFAYVPGSHRLTPERLAWEDAEARTATQSADPHHAAGSFRLTEDGLGRLGYGGLQRFPVPGNTLVVADTYGFHRRVESLRPTVRTSLYGVARRNPFAPWNGLDVRDLPFVRDRGMSIYLAGEDRRAKRGKKVVYANVGTILAGAEQQL